MQTFSIIDKKKRNKYPEVTLGTNLFSGKSFQVTIKKWRLKNKNQVYPTSDFQNIFSLSADQLQWKTPFFIYSTFQF
jgi:hypothetical protein